MSTWSRHHEAADEVPCDCAGCRRAATRKAKRERAATRLAALEAVADLVRRKQCCDGDDARQTEEMRAALDALEETP